MPIHKIRFYQSGVAQFERAGRVQGIATTIALPNARLDDVLKTIVVYRGATQLPSVSVHLDSQFTKEAALALARQPSTSTGVPGYLELLRSLEGEMVEVADDHRTVRGRLVHASELAPETGAVAASAGESHPSSDPPAPDAEAAKAKAEQPQTPTSKLELTVVGENAKVERVVLERIAWFRAADPALSARLERAVSESSVHAEDRSRSLRILTGAGGETRVSYVTESPIWRASYRLRLAPNVASAGLQGSAVIHNDTEEPWNSVQIELSNREPDSLLSSLAAPRYWRRASGESELSKAHLVEQSNAPAERPESNAVSADDRSSPSSSSVAIAKRQAVGIAARRSEFLYRVAPSTTLPAHSSALVPFLDTRVKVVRGVSFDGESDVGRSIIHLENTSQAPLPSGTMAVFEGDRYCGEVEVDQLEPGRWGNFDFGTELGVTRKHLPTPDPVITYLGATWKDDALTVEKDTHSERTVEFHNTTDEDRVVFIAVAGTQDPRVKGADGVETNDGRGPTVARILVPAHKNVNRTLIIDEKTTEESSIDRDSPELPEDASKAESFPPPARAILREVGAVFKAKTALEERKQETEQEIARIEESIGRLGEGQAQGPLATRILELETQRSRLQVRVSQFERSIEQNRNSLFRTLGKLPSK